MKTFWEQCHFFAWTVLVLLLGYMLGAFALAVEQISSPAPVRALRRDLHRRAPIVHVREIRDGEIIGVIGTGARLVFGERVVIPRPDRSFAIDASPFLVNIIDAEIPEGALFVASARGKNYYPVASSAGQKLAPQNRVYFRSAEEAERAGYKPGR